ncbi:MAG TPA: NAD-dependent epimerase/dehydratase family protein [Candidatus Propionivibrio aalborgensis]|nr:NAD-dependent epimerase/dehydratase family protein [Candidatus Propionivibrio aalborgensis]
MNWLITGGSGFIGSNLCQSLARDGESFRIIDKRPSPFFPGKVIEMDILDQEQLVQSVSGDTIVHLAAEHRDDIRPRDRYDQVNVEGTRNICRAASLRGIDRIVFTSSVAVYGFAAPDTGEDGAIDPFNDYGRTKFEAEEVLRAWQAEAPERRSLVIIRPTVVFGPGNRGNVFNLISQIARGRFVMVGVGENRKSMAYVENVVAFIRHMAKSGPGVHLSNYIDKPDLSMNELVSHVRATVLGKPGVGLRLPSWLGMGLGHVADGVTRITGKRLPLSAIRVRKFTTSTAFATRAHQVPGFVAPVSLADGMARTLDAEFLHPEATRPIFYTE